MEPCERDELLSNIASSIRHQSKLLRMESAKQPAQMPRSPAEEARERFRNMVMDGMMTFRGTIPGGPTFATHPKEKGEVPMPPWMVDQAVEAAAKPKRPSSEGGYRKRKAPKRKRSKGFS